MQLDGDCNKDRFSGDEKRGGHRRSCSMTQLNNSLICLQCARTQKDCIEFISAQIQVFMNLLGYKEPNLVHLARCKVIIFTMHFFMYHGIFFSSMENTFYHPPWKILFLPPSKIFLSAMDKFSISSRLVIWNLDPRANVVRQEAQSRALRRR